MTTPDSFKFDEFKNSLPDPEQEALIFLIHNINWRTCNDTGFNVSSVTLSEFFGIDVDNVNIILQWLTKWKYIIKMEGKYVINGVFDEHNSISTNYDLDSSSTPNIFKRWVKNDFKIKPIMVEQMQPEILLARIKVLEAELELRDIMIEHLMDNNVVEV